MVPRLAGKLAWSALAILCCQENPAIAADDAVEEIVVTARVKFELLTAGRPEMPLTRQWLAWSLGSLLIVAGLVLTTGGAYLAFLGGSIYYASAGLACLLAGYLTIRKRPTGVLVYSIATVATAIWAVAEVGFEGWALVPRLLGPGIFLLLLGLATPPADTSIARGSRLALWSTAALLVVIAIAAVLDHRFHPAADSQRTDFSAGMVLDNGEDWHGFGGGKTGLRYSPAAQITTSNVQQLEVAWVYHSGDRLAADVLMGAYEVTPTKVGDTLYLCTPHDIVIALHAASGQQKWRFDPKVPDGRWKGFSICRGVTYFESMAPDSDGRCRTRVALGTLDFRLIVLDAADGRPCREFGNAGTVDLARGFGRLPPGAVAVTAPPTFIDDKLVLGHFVMDNQRTDSPSGVVRAYDAASGALRWAWDMAAPSASGDVREEQIYSPGTPNAWSVFAADDELNLVYLPTGNAGADYFGGHRSSAVERFSSAIVALDAATGLERWTFQTVHHDVWDYDVAAQPVLLDLQIDGRAVPALVQGTKTGQLFVLDRRTGEPLVPVDERPVSTDAVPGERLAYSQPYSEMPDLAGAALHERDAWGISPIDQMLCRIQFRQSRYRGQYTSLGLQPTLIYPGIAGGIGWGGIAIDPARGILVASTIHIANRGRQISRTAAEQAALKAQGDPGVDAPAFFPYPQKGTPYAVQMSSWLSGLDVPCQRPPWGLLTAIDLGSRSVLWQRPLGDASRSGPLGIASRLPISIGTPNQGGALTTAGGLTFIASAMDERFRAYETTTGRLLWQTDLPGGGHAGPATYAVGGQQYIVIAAGGHTLLKTRTGDQLIAYRLKQ